MKKFLIQTVNGEIKHDFCFHLLEAIRYHNWFYNQTVYEYILSDEIIDSNNLIPVGSLEFVFEYLDKNFRIFKERIYPINVPVELRQPEFLRRNMFIADSKDITLSKPMFVKSATQYKSFTEIVSKTEQIPRGKYVVSDEIEIDSEWRVFVHNRELVGLKHYLGDFTLFPDVSFIKKAIDTYKDCPPAYTLDIGINKDGCFVIEVHPFISCGLYGFNDYKRLPLMFVQAFQNLLNKHLE